MSITFGAIGDIISVSLLAKDLVIALSDTRGSAPEYQGIIRELLFLDQALLKVESLGRRSTAPGASGSSRSEEVQALYGTARQTVDRCRESIRGFRERIQKYDRHLGTDGGSGSGLRDAARKVGWKACGKSEEIARFRVELTGYTESLGLLLATVGLTSLDITASEVRTAIDATAQETAKSLSECRNGLREVRERLAENGRNICRGNSLGYRIRDRVQWIGDLCCGLKQMLCCVIAGNCAVYQELLSLRSMVAPLVASSSSSSLTLLHHPRAAGDESSSSSFFVFEDACGIVAPIPLSLVSSWDIFQDVLESRFRGRPGLSKIRRREYVLREEGTDRKIRRGDDIGRDILPGSRVAQEIVFHQDVSPSEEGDPVPTSCPCCHEEAGDSGPSLTRCLRCSRFFRRERQPGRIQRIPESGNFEAGGGAVQSIAEGPQQAKRKRDTQVDLKSSTPDADLYPYFRRICIVLRCMEEEKEEVAPKAQETFLADPVVAAEDWDDWAQTLDRAEAGFQSSLQSFCEYRRASPPPVPELDFDLSSVGSEQSEDVFVPPPLTGAAKELEGRMITAPMVWGELQQRAQFQKDDLDIDGLCSELKKKARCSGSGVVVEEIDFKAVMDRYLA